MIQPPQRFQPPSLLPPRVVRITKEARRELPLETRVNIASLVWGVVFGSIGFGFFLYGKKQHAVVPLVCGVGLMTIAYFVSNLFLLVAIGVAFLALPYFLRL